MSRFNMLQIRTRGRTGVPDGLPAGALLAAIERSGVPSFRQVARTVAAELRRCRRFERPLTVLLADLQQANPARTAEVECMLFMLLGTMLRDATREFDIVSYAVDDHAYVLFLPETDGAGAHVLAERLSATFRSRTGAELRIGSAAFPTQGLTLDALLASAAERLANPHDSTVTDDERRPLWQRASSGQ
jgi:GGDEF domain-containing protein